MAKGKRVSKEGGSAGLPADAAGNPAIDPTENVKALTEAEARRQDDMRESDSKHVRELLQLYNDNAALRAECAHEIAELRDRHTQEMRTAEAARINAIREVDTQAVAAAATVAATQASTLAAQVQTSAETLRTQVAAAAGAATVALGAALEPIQKDVADLRRVQYEQQGARGGAVDETAQRRSTTSIALVAAGLAFSTLIGLAGIAVAFLR